MALVVALYLQDTALLLYRNEAVLEYSGGAYHVRFGAHDFQLAGRSLLLPNPFTPWRPVFRFAWHVQAKCRPAQALDLEAVRIALQPATWGLAPLAAGLFAGLPLCLYFNAGWGPFLTLVGVMYAATVYMLVQLWRQRRPLALRPAAMVAIALEALLCLPCALNLTRKMASRIHMSDDLLDAAQGRLSREELERATAFLVRRVEERIETVETDSAEWRVLSDYRARLLGGRG